MFVLDVKAYAKGCFIQHVPISCEWDSETYSWIVVLMMDVYITLHFDTKGCQKETATKASSSPTYFLYK